jgi:hypothetical protein
MNFSLSNQLTQFDKSIENYFSRIRLQIGAECGLAISDVLKKTKFQARNLRNSMKTVGKDLLEIAVNFQDSADVFELKADNLFSKVKTFLLDSEFRLTQMLTTNMTKLFNALNPLHDYLEENTSTVLEKIPSFSTFTSNRLNDIPTKDFVISTSEQYSVILSNKLMDLEDKINHNFLALKNELMDNMKSLADKTDSASQNLRFSPNSSQSENTEKKKPMDEDEDKNLKPNEYKKDHRKHKPPGKNEPFDEHSNLKIKIMKDAKSCERMDNLFQLLSNIDIFDSPMNFDFYIPEIHGVDDPLDQFIKNNKFPSPTSCSCPLCNTEMPPYKMETDDVWSSHLLNEHEFLFGSMDICYQFLQYGVPNFNFAWFPMDQS